MLSPACRLRTSRVCARASPHASRCPTTPRPRDSTKPIRLPDQVYMLLIILLMLSQDGGFVSTAHAVMLPTVPWFKERLLHDISVGSLLVVVLVRTTQYNLSRLQDLYVQTNCLAALANMAPCFKRIHPYAARDTPHEGGAKRSRTPSLSPPPSRRRAPSSPSTTSSRAASRSSRRGGRTRRRSSSRTATSSRTRTPLGRRRPGGDTARRPTPLPLRHAGARFGG